MERAPIEGFLRLWKGRLRSWLLTLLERKASRTRLRDRTDPANKIRKDPVSEGESDITVVLPLVQLNKAAHLLKETELIPRGKLRR
mgnify:CR=1 FL=1